MKTLLATCLLLALPARLALAEALARQLGQFRSAHRGEQFVAQFAGEFFHDRRFARAADGQVADADDLAAERMRADEAFAE